MIEFEFLVIEFFFLVIEFKFLVIEFKFLVREFTYLGGTSAHYVSRLVPGAEQKGLYITKSQLEKE